MNANRSTITTVAVSHTIFIVCEPPFIQDARRAGAVVSSCLATVPERPLKLQSAAVPEIDSEIKAKVESCGDAQ